MRVNELDYGVIYIEDALPNAAEFMRVIEEHDTNADLYPVIPAWEEWYDGGPVRTEDGWKQIVEHTHESHRGRAKHFDWDLNENQHWPRKQTTPDFSKAHNLADKIINLIEPDYIKALDVWAGITGNTMPAYITRNYCLREYRTGGAMGAHIDKNIENPINTMDWTALLYLNDDYEGGDLSFHARSPEELDALGTDYNKHADFFLSPKAGSIVMLPCTVTHAVSEITAGNKAYLFLFMHTKTNITSGLGEPYYPINDAIERHQKEMNHGNV
jgi:predicted 2-oxoglutarate/Fe(II)-dependent dioxygenase YbiX